MLDFTDFKLVRNYQIDPLGRKGWSILFRGVELGTVRR